MINQPSPFNKILRPDIPLENAWQQAEELDGVEELSDEGMRYFRPANLLLREHLVWHYLGGIKAADEFNPNALIDASERHLKMLREFGMAIISHVNEPVSRLDLSRVAAAIESPDDDDTVFAYGASPYIPNLLCMGRAEAYEYTSVSKVNKSILNPLYKYLLWCNAESEPYRLNDIYDAEQYSIHPGNGKVFLHDFDPAIRFSQTDLEHDNRHYSGLAQDLSIIRHL